MGCPEGRAMLSGFIPNGLLPNKATSVTQVLDQDRWILAEERTAELLAHIQPNKPSEERRNAVASYLQRLIMKCFSCQVFTFGSVPLKTYLTDGDIDLTAFSNNQNLKDSWAHEVRDILESEKKSEDAEFRVKEVQYIQAEVKIVKCLVENIVVDISFNQLGGLCTLCFLEEVDNLVRENHLFKRSIILIKAWCYYESRILGAHHGLISTYALETLVLYIFHVYSNTFAGPLEVLYRFLDFFSKFDWDNYCISLRGPVPIGSLPKMRAEPPRKDCQELLFSELFLDACKSYYGVMPSSQENQEQPFVSKYFNIIDPLRANNNLGRSVSKGNFFRIRSAIAFGAQRLVKLLDCPEENLIAEFDLFFRNTWDRHGKDYCLDAPSYDLYARNKNVENSTRLESEVEQAQASHGSHGVYQKPTNHLKESKQMFGTSDVSAVSQTWSSKTKGIFTDVMASDIKHTSSMKNALTDKGQSTKYSSNEVHSMHHFDRVHSNPEFAHISGEVPFQHKHTGVSVRESGQSHSTSSMIDNSRRSSSSSEVLGNHNNRVSAENQQSLRKTSYDWRSEDAVYSKNASNSYYCVFGLGVNKEDGHSVDKAMRMHQEEHDFMNITETYRKHSFTGYLQAPVNVNSGNLSFPVGPPVLASGYTHANSFGTLPVNVPSFDSFWGHNMPYSQGLAPFPALQWFPSVGMTLNQEEITESVDDNVLVAHLDHDCSDEGFWSEQDMNSVRVYDNEDGNIQDQQQRDRKMVASCGSSSGNSSWLTSSGSYSPKNYGETIEHRWLTRKIDSDDPPDERTIDSDVNSTASSRYTPASHSNSRTNLSSFSLSNGSPSNTSKLTKDQRVLKSAYTTLPFAVHERRYEGKLVDHISSQPDDVSGDWTCQSSVGTDLAESTAAETVTSDAQAHQLASYRQGPMTVSNSTVPDTPVLVGPGSSQRAVDNQGLLPFAFCPSGPPFPIHTMFPLYNIPTETGTLYTAANHMDMDAELGNLHAQQSSVSLDSTERPKQSDTFHKSNHINHDATSESFVNKRSDILDGDFPSYWLNLQYGRFCQNAQLQRPLLYRPSVVPPMYLQGNFPWDAPGRPSANMNIMAHGPPLVPMMPIRRGSDSHMGINQRIADGLPRYRSGTGTYLPNPISYERYYRSKHYSNTRNQRGNNKYDRKDHHGEREGNWNFNSKPRFASRGQFRYQVEKPHIRMDKTDLSNRRPNRQWNSFMHGSFSASKSCNGSFNPSTPYKHFAANMPYNLHPPPVVSTSEIYPSESTLFPSIFMMYPYDQNIGHDYNEWLEFGSFGPEHFSGTNEASHQGEGSHSAINELANFERDSADSSPDQASSPNFLGVLQD